MIFAWILNAGVVWFVVCVVLLMMRQRRKKRTQQESHEMVVSSLAGLAMGAMMLGFQAIYQPQVRHAIVETQKEEMLDDDNGGEPPGGRTFHEQLRSVRQGEEVETLTPRVDAAGGGSRAD